MNNKLIMMLALLSGILATAQAPKAQAQLIVYNLDMEIPTKWEGGTETGFFTPSYPYKARTGSRVGSVNQSQAGAWRDISVVTDLPPAPFQKCFAGLFLQSHHYASDIYMTVFDWPSGRVIKDVKLDSQIDVFRLDQWQHFSVYFDRRGEQQIKLRIGYYGNGLVSFIMVDDGYVECEM